MTYSRLLSAGPDATAPELLAEVRPRERAPQDRPFLFVNMVSTIDGRAQVRGRSREETENPDCRRAQIPSSLDCHRFPSRCRSDLPADRHRSQTMRPDRATMRRPTGR